MFYQRRYLLEKDAKLKQFGYSPLGKECQELEKVYGFDKKGYYGYKNKLTSKKEDEDDKNSHKDTKYKKLKIFYEQKDTF